MEKHEGTLTVGKIFFFWTPLAATWLMMSIEGPFLAAIIARLADPKFNLAAYGVAFSFALMVESPIIMIMSASTALVKDRDSFYKLRNFTYIMNGIITAIMLILLIPNVFYLVTEAVIGLPRNVAVLTHHACIVLLPWPGAIGYRRFYQGILIRSYLTRRVAYGTVLRLTGMAATALIFYLFFEMDGAVVGGAALAVGVSLEAIASKLMAVSSVKRLLSKTQYPAAKADQALSYGAIAKFYYPLALTSILGLAVHPMMTFFLGQSKMAIESLAVIPVINSLVFIFRSMGLSYQEVGIALMGENHQGFRPLRNFAVLLGISVSGALCLLAFSPLSVVWFHHISGLSLSLTDFSIFPTQIMTLLPGLTVLLAFQRAFMVNNKNTAPITLATAIEVVSIVTILFISIHGLDLVGAVAAGLAFVLGRMAANGYLFIPFLRVLRREKIVY